MAAMNQTMNQPLNQPIGMQSPTTVTYQVPRRRSSLADACVLILLVLLPPLGIVFVTGSTLGDFLICLCLTLLGYIPGIIYGLFVFFRKE